MLVLHFLNRINQANQRNVSLSAEAIKRLQRHAWPGNIRELSNVIERMVLLADHALLSAADVDRYLPRENEQAAPTPPWPRHRPASLPILRTSDLTSR